MSTLQSILQRGTAASQPAANTVPVGTLYFQTDTFFLQRSNGSTWDSYGPVLLVGDSGSGGTRGLVPAPASGDASAGKFLKADATWAVPTSGGGGLVLLEQHTASASATIDFTTGITSSYDDYVFEFINLVNATNTVDLLVRFSTDGGSTFSSTGYEYIFYDGSTSGVNGTLNSASATAILLFTGIDNSQSYGVSGSIKLFDPLNASLKKTMTYQLSAPFQSTARRYMITGSGFWGTITAVNAVRFLYSSGNITSGTIRLYGVAKS